MQVPLKRIEIHFEPAPYALLRPPVRDAGAGQTGVYLDEHIYFGDEGGGGEGEDPDGEDPGGEFQSGHTNWLDWGFDLRRQVLAEFKYPWYVPSVLRSGGKYTGMTDK
jgi:hypothetical protein